MINRMDKICLYVLSIVSMVMMPGVGFTTSSSQAFEQLSMFNQQLTAKSKPKALQPDVKSIAETQQLKESQVSPKSPSEPVNNKPTVISSKEVVTDEDAINQAAFKQVRKKLFPLTHDQVIKLHKDQEAQEFTLASSAGTPPRPAVTTQVVRLDPGSTPSVIRLGQGFISSVVFLDSTGAPWPIIAYDLGDPSAYNIQWDKSGNTMMIQSKKLYTYGNMAVRLQGLNTPVMLTIVPGQQVIDYRVDMRVLGYGPNAKNIPTGLSLPEATSDVLMQVLDDVPPPGGTLMTVKGGPAKAWTVGHTMYVRTRLTILSPGWISMMSSADGMHVYKMSDSPILLVSWHGKVMQLKIEGL